MRSLSATEAARRFSEVLDAVADRGESFVVMRRGRAVARIGPASARGAHVKALLRSRPRDDAWTEELLELIPVEEYGLEVARAHATLLAHTRRSGRARGAHDLLIAPTAASRQRIVITANAAGFGGLPGVEVRAAT